MSYSNVRCGGTSPSSRFGAWARFVPLLGAMLFVSAPTGAQQMTQRDWETAEALYGAKRFQEAARIYENIAADHAYPLAQFRLGLMFHRGEGVAEDCMQAARWYTLAANQGEYAAAYNLSNLYQYGCPNFPADSRAAFRWLEKAALSGSHTAMAEVAIRWLNEKNVSRQFEAFDYASRAASGGVSEGYVALALLYREGFGVGKDNQQAMQLAKKAEESPTELINGKARSAELLAQFYESGVGTPPDPVEALAWSVIAQSRSAGDSSEAAELTSDRARNLSEEQRRAAYQLASEREKARAEGSQ